MQVCVDLAIVDERGSSAPAAEAVERVETLMPGDIIGRMRQAALRINHPAISEAHALVSLRGTTLRLLALRGRFVVGGQKLAEIVLSPGTSIGLTADVALRVVDVLLPPQVVALVVPGLGKLVPPPVSSILAGGPEPVPGFAPDALAVVWIDGELVHVRRPPPAPDLTLVVGEGFEVAGQRYEVVDAPLVHAGVAATAADTLAPLPLTLILRQDIVHLQRAQDAFPITGVPARIITLLASHRLPVDWRVIARSIWPAQRDEARLRMYWDAGLARARRRLREIGARTDLVHTDGAGRAELMLGPEDRLVRER